MGLSIKGLQHNRACPGNDLCPPHREGLFPMGIHSPPREILTENFRCLHQLFILSFSSQCLPSSTCFALKVFLATVPGKKRKVNEPHGVIVSEALMAPCHIISLRSCSLTGRQAPVSLLVSWSLLSIEAHYDTAKIIIQM